MPLFTAVAYNHRFLLEHSENEINFITKLSKKDIQNTYPNTPQGLEYYLIFIK